MEPQSPRRIASQFLFTTRPVGAPGLEPGIHVRIFSDRWYPDVVFVEPTSPKKAAATEALLPMAGHMNPVEGGEERMRGGYFLALNEPASADFDPWELAKAPNFDLLKLPLARQHQVTAAIGINAYRELIEKEGKFALDAIDQCIAHSLVQPHWLQEAFRACFSSFNEGRVGTLDEAFGRGQQSGNEHMAQAKRVAKRNELMACLIREVEADPTLPIDRRFFTRAGRRCGLGGSLAEKTYYEAKAAGFQDLGYYRSKLLAERNFGDRGYRTGRSRLKKLRPNQPNQSGRPIKGTKRASPR